MFYDSNGNIIKEVEENSKFNCKRKDGRKIPLSKVTLKSATHKDQFMRTQINYDY